MIIIVMEEFGEKIFMKKDIVVDGVLKLSIVKEILINLIESKIFSKNLC